MYGKHKQSLEAALRTLRDEPTEKALELRYHLADTGDVVLPVFSLAEEEPENVKVPASFVAMEILSRAASRGWSVSRVQVMLKEE